MEQAWPEGLRDVVGDERVVFALREGRYISRAGLRGGIGVGLAAIAFAAILMFGTGPLTLSSGGTEGDVELGASGNAPVAGVLALIGAGFLIASAILRSRPGGFVVATPTRLVRAGRRIEVLAWDDVSEVTLESDGSIGMRSFRVGSQLPSTLNQIVQPPQGADVMNAIRGLLPPRAFARTPAPPDGAPAAPEPGFADYAFEARRGAAFALRPRSVLTGWAVIAVGLVLATLAFGMGFGEGETTMTIDGGPPTPVEKGSLLSFVPLVAALGLTAVGVLMVRRGRRQPAPARVLLTSRGMVVQQEGREESVYAWERFEGRVDEIRGEAGVDLQFQLRGGFGAHRNGAPVLFLFGVEPADRALAALRERLPR